MIRVALPFGSTPENKRGPYRQALAAASIQPVETAATLARLDGLLLAGGSDIDPAVYSAARQSETGAPDRDRDSLEAALLREALDRDLPVLAICRGLQLLNVALGGTLVQAGRKLTSPSMRGTSGKQSGSRRQGAGPHNRGAGTARQAFRARGAMASRGARLRTGWQAL